MGLNPRQLAFVNEYVVDFKGGPAAIRAGYSEIASSQAAFQLLSNSEVVAAIQERQAELAAKAGLTCEWVLRQWKQIAEADPAELIRLDLECCRHCYGTDHEFQWTEFEYTQAVRAAAAHRCGKDCGEPCVKGVPPPNLGGFGYDPKLAPAEDCPACQGKGIERVIVADTRRLRGSARRLYAGVKQTRDGIEIKMRDQDAALNNIAKYLGMLVEKRELSGPGGTPIQVANVTAQDLSDDQLAMIIDQQAQFSSCEPPALPVPSQ